MKQWLFALLGINAVALSFAAPANASIDLQMFAQAPSGEYATIMIGKETVFGTAVTPTVALIASSQQWDGNNTLIERPGARQRAGQTEALAGPFVGKGQGSFEVDPDTFGAILLASMGAETYAANSANPGSAPTVSTTLTAAQGTGWGWATPAAMTNITPGQYLTVDTSTNQETVYVRAVTATQFYAYFTKSHLTSVTVVQATQQLAYNHTFTLAIPRVSFTAQLNDVISAKNTFGNKVDTLSLKISPKAILEAQLATAYQGELNQASPTSPTYSTTHGLVFETPGNAVTWQGTAAAQSVQGITIDINTGLMKDYPKFGQGRYYGQFPEMQSVVKVTADLAFESTQMLQAFWGNPTATGPAADILPGQLVITFASIDWVNTGVAYGLQIIVPMAKPATAPVTRKTKDYLKQSVQFNTSESQNGAGDDIKFILTNSNAGASF